MQKLSEVDERWNEIGPYALDINSTVSKDLQVEVATKIRKFYLRDQPMTKNNIYSLINLFSDRIYKADCEKAIRAHSAAVKSPVYYYYYSYVLQMPSMIIRGIKKGAAHSDDGRLIFPIVATPMKLKTNDEEMMKHFIGFVDTYAKTNKPLFNGIDWKSVDPKSQDIDYLDIRSPNDVSMKKFKEIVPNEFWDSLPIMENNKLI